MKNFIFITDCFSHTNECQYTKWRCSSILKNTLKPIVEEENSNGDLSVLIMDLIMKNSIENKKEKFVYMLLLKKIPPFDMAYSAKVIKYFVEKRIKYGDKFLFFGDEQNMEIAQKCGFRYVDLE